MKITLHEGKTPTRPGFYIFQGTTILPPELMHVDMIPERYYGGVQFASYLGVVNERGRSVENYKGSWSEELTFNEN
jgi:hypothetical protein